MAYVNIIFQNKNLPHNLIEVDIVVSYCFAEFEEF